MDGGRSTASGSRTGPVLLTLTPLHVGQQIRVERLRQHLSIEGLASQLGVAASTLSMWERGQRRLAVGRLIDIAGLLGCEPAAFLRSAAEAD